jgi:hypothetical protein
MRSNSLIRLTSSASCMRFAGTASFYLAGWPVHKRTAEDAFVNAPGAAALQDREVTVYRLVSKATYEQQLFECASRKYGLDEAILGFGGGERSSSTRTHASHAATSTGFIRDRVH